MSYKNQIVENQEANNKNQVVENQEWMVKIKLWRIMSQAMKITIFYKPVVECQTGESNNGESRGK